MRIVRLTALLVGVGCFSPEALRDGGLALVHGPDAQVDNGPPDGGSEDSGQPDSGRWDAGRSGLCGSCQAGNDDCEARLECREVGGGVGYCASFEPTCLGSAPDVRAVELDFYIPCSSAPRSFPACEVRARLELADAGLSLRGIAFDGDGGTLVVTGRSIGVESARAWESLALGCYPPQYRFPDDSCLTHSNYFVATFELSDGGLRSQEFYAGSSQLPSRAYIAGVVAIVAEAKAFFDGGL
jgi:hypothetical protein